MPGESKGNSKARNGDFQVRPQGGYLQAENTF